MKRKKLLLVGAVIITAIATELVASSLVTKMGGTTAYSIYPGNTFDFVVHESDFTEDGYYKPSGRLAFWVIHSPAPDCGNGDTLECLCNLPAFMDPSQINTYGWPFTYSYSHAVCGIYDTYLPTAALLDISLLAALYAVAFAAIIKIWRTLMRPRLRTHA